MQDISKNSFQVDISSFKDGHELQIYTIVSRNLVCVDECLHFQEYPKKIYEFPYFDFTFEHYCNEELELVIEHKNVGFYISEEEEEFHEFEFKRDVSYGYIREYFQERTMFSFTPID